MTKNISYTAITYFLVRASFIGLSFKLLLTNSNHNVYFNILVASFIGIIPLFFLNRIAAYKENLTIRDKALYLFPKLYLPIIGTLFLISLFFGIITFNNLLNFTNINFLNKTPIYVVALAFLSPLLMIISHDMKILARVALILFYIAIFLFLICLAGLIPSTDLYLVTPSLNKTSIVTFIGMHISPLFMLLMFPNNKIRKSLSVGYIIGVISLLITAVTIIGVLGIELAVLYHYPELHALRSMDYYQWANILSLIWILDMFILCALSFYFANYLLNLINWQKYIIPIIIFISGLLFAKNSPPFIEYLSILSTSSFLLLLILFNIKITIKK